VTNTLPKIESFLIFSMKHIILQNFVMIFLNAGQKKEGQKALLIGINIKIYFEIVGATLESPQRFNNVNFY